MNRLKESTQNIILNRIKIAKQDDVYSRRFESRIPKAVVSRERIKIYSRTIRGSVRLNQGRFYTFEEHQRRIQEAKKIILP